MRFLELLLEQVLRDPLEGFFEGSLVEFGELLVELGEFLVVLSDEISKINFWRNPLNNFWSNPCKIC